MNLFKLARPPLKDNLIVFKETSLSEDWHPFRFQKHGIDSYPISEPSHLHLHFMYKALNQIEIETMEGLRLARTDINAQ